LKKAVPVDENDEIDIGPGSMGPGQNSEVVVISLAASGPRKAGLYYGASFELEYLTP